MICFGACVGQIYKEIQELTVKLSPKLPADFVNSTTVRTCIINKKVITHSEIYLLFDTKNSQWQRAILLKVSLAAIQSASEKTQSNNDLGIVSKSSYSFYPN